MTVNMVNFWEKLGSNQSSNIVWDEKFSDFGELDSWGVTWNQLEVPPVIRPYGIII